MFERSVLTVQCQNGKKQRLSVLLCTLLSVADSSTLDHLFKTPFTVSHTNCFAHSRKWRRITLQKLFRIFFCFKFPIIERIPLILLYFILTLVTELCFYQSQSNRTDHDNFLSYLIASLSSFFWLYFPTYT